MESFRDIVLRYDGKIASSGRMHLYEYGRAQYAFSRLLTTVEQYRRTGIIIDRVTRDRRIDLIVSAPKQGSFALDVAVAAEDQGNVHLKGVSLELLLAYVFDRLVPKSEEFGPLIRRLAKLELKARQSLSSGSRGDDDPDWTAELARIAEDGTADVEQALHVIDDALAKGSFDEAGVGYDEIRRAQELLSSDLRRERLLRDGLQNLRGLKPEDIDRLAAKLRPLVQEMAVPLGKSADDVSVGLKTRSDAFLRVDAQRVEAIQARTISEEIVKFEAKITSYDVETGSGRMRIPSQQNKKKNFTVEAAMREDIKPAVIAAMDQTVGVVCAQFVDANGVVTSYMLRGIE